MDYQNLAYALTQVAHNFGAVIVVAAPIYMLAAPSQQHARGVLWLVLTGWLVQIASGLSFGLVSFYYYGQLPDIRGLAVMALIIKILSAGLGAGLTIATLREAISLASPLKIRWLWVGLAALGVIALTAAAFLRWYS